MQNGRPMGNPDCTKRVAGIRKNHRFWKPSFSFQTRSSKPMKIRAVFENMTRCFSFFARGSSHSTISSTRLMSPVRTKTTGLSRPLQLKFSAKSTTTASVSTWRR